MFRGGSRLKLHGGSSVQFQEDKEKMRPWSDLPVDFLSMIMGHLCLIDQIRFRAVCKDWRLVPFVKTLPKLPWLMTHDWFYSNNGNILSINKFYMPSVKQTNISQHELDGEEWEDIFGASICASKFGWLFLQRSKKSFLYNPFTTEILMLPNMDITFNRTTFSSIPTSPDCVFFAIQSSKEEEKIKISTCALGDLQWTTNTFDGFSKVIEDVVYMNGNFYCVFSGGVLGVYDTALQDWSLLTGMTPITGVTFRHRSQLVDSVGELLLVCFSESVHIYRFDWSQMIWVSRNSLENEVLFLGCTSFAIPASEDASDLSDRVYFQGNTRTCFHSFKTRKCHQCSEIYPWDTERELEKVWIEPPQF